MIMSISSGYLRFNKDQNLKLEETKFHWQIPRIVLLTKCFFILLLVCFMGDGGGQAVRSSPGTHRYPFQSLTQAMLTKRANTKVLKGQLGRFPPQTLDSPSSLGPECSYSYSEQIRALMCIAFKTVRSKTRQKQRTTQGYCPASKTEGLQMQACHFSSLAPKHAFLFWCLGCLLHLQDKLQIVHITGSVYSEIERNRFITSQFY